MPVKQQPQTMATKLSLKLLVDKKSNKVLFAEAGKEFIDFLFNLLTLPLGSVTKLLTRGRMVGCIGRLYGSVENLSGAYIQPNQNKKDLLNPKTSSPQKGKNPPLFLQNVTSTARKKLYVCTSCSHQKRYYTDVNGTLCRNCKHRMSTEITYVGSVNVAVGSDGDEGGYVKAGVIYMVMDDLVVTPMSTISSITLLNNFKNKEVGEKVVKVGMDEGLALLKASLKSKTVLTDVFLGKAGVV
ncbi:uncharacterized protein LOC131244252 [Magnolia sinica]|uniref:uncharacterized protein LOC131244252 n=1 Tax=Magnolia sinica TaxID=86752 RepID=UPI0026589368|nr:uncharacterized protein LOC131244252 [Magnolia sinica]